MYRKRQLSDNVKTPITQSGVSVTVFHLKLVTSRGRRRCHSDMVDSSNSFHNSDDEGNVR